jgi:hypothetical protein
VSVQQDRPIHNALSLEQQQRSSHSLLGFSASFVLQPPAHDSLDTVGRMGMSRQVILNLIRETPDQPFVSRHVQNRGEAHLNAMSMSVQY